MNFISVFRRCEESFYDCEGAVDFIVYIRLAHWFPVCVMYSGVAEVINGTGNSSTEERTN